VAAGLVPLASGSDTGGSIQIPASYNGIVGLRATKGLVSRRGIVPLAEISDVPGPLATSVADVALALGPITGVDRRDPATKASRGHLRRDYTPFLDPDGLAGARIGVLNRAFKTSLRPQSPEVTAGLADAIETMRGAGATVVEDLPELRSRRAGWPVFIKVLGPQFPAELDAWFAGPGRGAPVDSLAEVIARSSKPRLRPKVKILKTLEDVQALPPPRGARYRRAERKVRHLRRDTLAYMRRHDLDALVFAATGCPAAPLPGVVDPAYSCGDATQPLEFGDNPGTIAPLLSPATGLPVLTLPGAALPGDLRTGISLLGPAWSEPELIRFGYGFERAGESG
jgi:amidase